ncbi:MAG: hypothetical protein WCC38_06910 [Pseudonocardiaceae bacterium]
MLVIAAAILFALAQAQTAQADAERAAAARRKAAAALAAKAQADDAFAEALVELDRVRAQSAAQLAAHRAATEQVHTELKRVRGAAAKAVTDAQEAAEATTQKAIVDRDRILAERTADMRQQIDRARADARAQIKALQSQVEAARVEAEQLVKRMRGELDYATVVTPAVTEKANADRAAELDQIRVARQQAQARLAAAQVRGLSGRRKSKMTPELVEKAQRMYDSRRFAMAEIAQSCAVSPTTIYRHIRTGQTTTR